MISLQKRIKTFHQLGIQLKQIIRDYETKQNDETSIRFEQKLHQAHARNGWFTEENSIAALKGILSWLQEDTLEKWVLSYPALKEEKSSKKVAVIMAGNIPLVNFHDFLAVLISGHQFIGKLSSQDDVLLPYLAELLIAIEPAFNVNIQFTTEIIKDVDAIIATGSDNSARYFEYYFQKYPNIIRKNRSSVAVLSGEETREDFLALGKDIFQYYGLGCRNVSHLFLPVGFDIKQMLDAWDDFQFVTQQSKYVNNYDYQKAIFLINNVPFYDNGFLLLKESETLATPVSVIHFQYYQELEEVKQFLHVQAEKIQCVATNIEALHTNVGLGKTQMPTLSDYPDGVDILRFLIHLH